MLPYINVFGASIPSYSLMTLIGLLCAGFFIGIKATKRGFYLYHAVMTLLCVAVGIAVGGCLLYGITNIKIIVLLFKNISKLSFLEFIAGIVYAFGGSVFYGGLIGGSILGLIYLKRTKMKVGMFCDIVAPGAALFHGFGRIGCFLAGCCYGAESNCGFVMTASEVTGANGVRRFPIQLVESAFEFLLFFLLWYLLSHYKFKNRLLTLYFAVYAIGRFTLEFFRGDAHRGIWFGLSTSQWISIGLFTVAVVIMTKVTISESKKKEVIQE
ncbi:MAG: prolipoprotein diacylglyceryl transferase [Clostridia bacterium]|nr:prolipoprotein diacylglyceryl transferase [Clostridia bacterium]